jgi:hypothetical protein
MTSSPGRIRRFNRLGSTWLLDLGAAALAKDPQLKDFSGFVQDSGDAMTLPRRHTSAISGMFNSKRSSSGRSFESTLRRRPASIRTRCRYGSS